MKTEAIGTDDIIDFRDITDRVEYLEEATRDDDEDEEYERLKTLLEDTAGYGGDHQWRGDWYPGSMIRHDYFPQYAEQFADDIGAINRDATWPLCHIDWDAAAESLKQDYRSITFDGTEYWYR